LLAHKNKEQLERLISKLQHKNIDIFIHLDSKADFEPSDINNADVIFTENRIDVGLFEFSMVKAQFELINTAHQYGKYDYYILMSAQCYPIRGIDYIYNYLSDHYPESFIEIVAPKEDNYVKVNFEHIYILKRLKLKIYAFLKKHFSFKAYRILRYIPGGMIFLISRAKELFVKSPKVNLQKMGFEMYCGSQWWILPDAIIEKMIKSYENKAYCKIVSDTFSCDETFFQTAIMSDSDISIMTPDDNGNIINRKWFYIFENGHPIILTKDHYDQIISSGMLFARKFDVTVDSEILNMLDETDILENRLEKRFTNTN